MDIKAFLNGYNDEIRCFEWDGGYDVGLPFKFYNDEATLSVFIREEPTGQYTITDNGNTLRYLGNRGVRLEDHAQKVKIICRKFHLTIENEIVSSTLADLATNQTYTQFSAFLIAITHLAALGYLD